MKTNIPDAIVDSLTPRLKFIYPEADSQALAKQLIGIMGVPEAPDQQAEKLNYWDQNDVWMITYGDSIVSDSEKPLATLNRFLADYTSDVLNGVHILPFFPFTSDDGFAVQDYYAVNPELGGWTEVQSIAKSFRLMSDLVINHCSSESEWFLQFKAGEEPGCNYFYTAPWDTDTSAVVRPRSSPLLTPVVTENGLQHVWCTFSADQVDFDFSNPDVLAEFINIISKQMDYGVRIFRLDAVGFLWKELGTNCMHLPQTHEIIKLLRQLMHLRDPEAIIITETNVPNNENLSYLGNGNEAHAIYNFSLPPLLVHALLTGKNTYLKSWMMSMPPAQFGTFYFNFIASHDGIGLRPTEGLLSQEEIDLMLDTVKKFGGDVSMRQINVREGDSVMTIDKPYEMNISLFDALQGTISEGVDEFQTARFIAAHAIMLSLEGVAAIYIHSLLGTENDYAKVEATGAKRSINRHQWQDEELRTLLADESSHHHQIYQAIVKLIQIRKKHAAFHPNATQYTLHLGEGLFAFWRQSIKRNQSIFSITNITKTEQELELTELNLIPLNQWFDLITGDEITDISATLTLAPYQTIWLSNQP